MTPELIAIAGAIIATPNAHAKARGTAVAL